MSFFTKKHKNSFFFPNKIYKKNYNKYSFDFLLISLESKIFYLEQFNSIYKIISKETKKRKGSFFVFIKPYFFLTSKPSESRMGGGKGNLSRKIVFLKKGQVLFGFNNFSLFRLYNLLSLISYKLPFKLAIINLKY